MIAAQRQKETELHQQKGLPPYFSKLYATQTTGDEPRYNQIADDYPNYATPTLSDISSPDQDTKQKRTYQSRLLALEAIPAPERLQFLNPEIAKELELDNKEKAPLYNLTQPVECIAKANVPSAETCPAAKLGDDCAEKPSLFEPFNMVQPS